MTMSAVSSTVYDAVERALSELESEFDVRAVLAVARGSHAWGAASPDSDYDVGFVFVEADCRRYAHLDGTRESVVEYATATVDGHPIDLEFQGWNVTTFAKLLAASNQGAIDLLRSPIRYRTTYDPDPLAAELERTFDPMDLYHDWRAIASNTYRTYLSDHLVGPDDEVFPIRDRLAKGYLVETDDGTTTIAADDERFTETATRQTVKGNLTVFRAAASARYLKRTGERGDHDLPALEFESFLEEQAPAVFDADRLECGHRLLERKRRGDGNAVIGDRVGREFAHPPRLIDPAVHARDGPDRTRLNDVVDAMIDASR
ncbi:hypothetical protein AArcMg_0931 [Natrarchaeobaculum sulfurireducens]|uniref:Nucleotidyltransferase n=2 Tax=Natrarchaeobaculum sulfurireducens TaxID=2044521 RepID=A0A346PN57_9EURY|nr:hypothetical protein AArcMg_0931 [Natrarchaeobaculum sulfurireducens]